MNTKIILVVLAAGAVAFFFVARRGDISGADARERVANGAALLDVRTPEEFAAGHLPEAINIPVRELAGRQDEIGPTTRPVVLYCRSGTRSGLAARALRKAGFSEVYNLGAMSRW